MRHPVVEYNPVPSLNELPLENGEVETLRCRECNVNFTSEYYLLSHLLHHIKQPSVLLQRIQPAPIKITLKSRSNNNFEIVSSPTTAAYQILDNLAESQNSCFLDKDFDSITDEKTANEQSQKENSEYTSDITNVQFSPNYVDGEAEISPVNSDDVQSPSNNAENITTDSPENIPGAEPTPPPDPSPEYPKIRIKTTGLLKESLTITEITDDNPNGDYRPSEIVDIESENHDSSNLWSSSAMEDPLKLPDLGDKDESNLLSSFFNNSDHAKDFGLSSSDNEFISLDRLDDRNRNALQVYNPSGSSMSQNPLDSLTGLPMQQLAQQVSRLQPSGNNGMHQQNVLINIQQFPQAPQPHGYQPQHLYPPHPGMPGQPPPPMYPPYQYQPPNHMYYPPAPGYPPAPPMPQPPQMPHHPPQPMQPQMHQQPMQGPQQGQQFRHPTPPRPPVPRQPSPRQFAQQPQRPPPIGTRQPIMRHRMPITRPRGPIQPTTIRGLRPRAPAPMNQNAFHGQQGQRMMKRTAEQIQALQAKKKRMDVLVPDKNDDPDCQVIAVQPKNTDGGLPQIQSVQGGTTDPGDNSIMHLSDSITLSVRNPLPRPQSPKKSDAKAVANILATRGITVTATPKPKERQSPAKNCPSPTPPVAINLNSAVSIIPAKNNQSSPAKPNGNGDPRLTTVDLTDDNTPESTRTPSKQAISPQKNNVQRGALPFCCELCPAKYPTVSGLNKHRQSYHKTGGSCEIGVPLIDFKQPGILQKLTSLGIYNYIPLPSSKPDGNFALPVVSVNAARNSSVCNLSALGATSILTLGPVRSLPKQTQNHNVPHKQ